MTLGGPALLPRFFLGVPFFKKHKSDKWQYLFIVLLGGATHLHSLQAVPRSGPLFRSPFTFDRIFSVLGNLQAVKEKVWVVGFVLLGVASVVTHYVFLFQGGCASFGFLGELFLGAIAYLKKDFSITKKGDFKEIEE